jgi:hypothetical protein
MKNDKDVHHHLLCAPPSLHRFSHTDVWGAGTRTGNQLQAKSLQDLMPSAARISMHIMNTDCSLKKSLIQDTCVLPPVLLLSVSGRELAFGNCSM